MQDEPKRRQLILQTVIIIIAYVQQITQRHTYLLAANAALVHCCEMMDLKNLRKLLKLFTI